METEWAFLQPWRESLCSVLQLPASAHDTGEFLAAFECWPDAWETNPPFVTADKCFLRVSFPTDPGLRRGRETPQRVREAIELFDFLAAVDNAAFESLLSEYFIHRNPPQQGTKGRPHVFWPTWECQLDGKLSSEEAVTTTSAVTWGQLFGCPLDPWKHSKEFRAAMNKLEKIKFKKGGKQHNKAASISWQVFGEFLFIFQEPANQGRAIRAGPLSRELNRVLELEVPPVVQLKAVVDGSKMVETWLRLPKRAITKPMPSKVEFAAGLYSDSTMPDIAVALARTDMSTFKLANTPTGSPLPDARVNAGFLLGTLVCGRPMFLPAGNSRSALERSGTCTRWDLQLSGISGKGFGAMLSAFTEATVIDTLVLSTVAADDGIRNDPVYWAWLTYAFWSKASQSSVQRLEISQINLTEEHVNTIKHVLTIIYPGPKAATGSARSRYGYVDMKKGTRERPTGERNRVLELSQDRCCRAFYDESSLDNVAKVVIPGFANRKAWNDNFCYIGFER